MRPVVKIGGSLLRSADDFIRAAKFLASYERPPVAVVSAVKGVTDMLLELYKTRSYLMFEEVAHRHISIARALGVEDEVAPLLKELEAALQLPKEPWAADYFASFGERLSATILAGLIRRMGVAVKLYIAPIATDSAFGNATPIRLDYADELREGRGGSDYTATYIGKEIGARKVSLITDAPGVMTADPREVEDAEVLPLMSIYEAVAAAQAGAKNFHPRTFQPVLEAGNMAVEVRSYHSRGTLIGHIYPPPPYKVVTRCGQGSCVVGLAAEELTKLGGVSLGRYTCRLDIPPRQAHELLIKPYIKYIK